LLISCATSFIVAASMGCGSSSSFPVSVIQSNTAVASKYRWIAPEIGSSTSLGTVQFLGGNDTLDVLHPEVTNINSSLLCTFVSSKSISSGQSMVETFASGSQTFHITISLSEKDSILSVDLASDSGLVQQVDLGSVAPSLNSSPIIVPYYSNQIYYLPTQQLFANVWWDWHNSGANAKSHNSLVYRPLTDGTRHPLREQFQVAISATLADILPQIANPASPYISKLAGKPIVDIWGSSDFGQVQADLVNLNEYGIDNCVYLIHNWQNQGYDNGLPGHYPANEALGGSEAIHGAVLAGQKDGCTVGLHQNYMDYYPNFDGFTSRALGVDSNGVPIPTWLNSEGIQAHETKPSWMLTSAQSQSPDIHSRYDTNAAFLDVNSSVDPWSRADLDATAAGEGSSSSWMKNAGLLWNYERTIETGPVFGEGSEHWYYSGLLDGAEAQMGAGQIIPSNIGPSLPLFVDFDLLRIHPLQINHGMGYYERWNPTASPQMTSVQMDQYRMQEIVFGHAPYVGTQYWNDVLHATVESRLIGPIAKNYGTAAVSSIQYQVDGNWVSSNIAATANEFSRVKVDYSSGLEVVVNSQQTQLSVGDVDLPQYGWLAKGAGILAYTALCGTSICDYAQSATAIFANARNPSHMISAGAYAEPAVSEFGQMGSGVFSIQYLWNSIRTFQGNGQPFVHFVNDSQLATNAGIAFQDGHTFPSLMSTWVPGQIVKDGPVVVQVPSDLTDGTYSVRVGVIDVASGSRLPLVGNDDGSRRYIVGYITLSGNGTKITFAAPPASPKDPRLNANGQVVTFPTLKTDSMVSIDQENGRWTLRSYPVGVASTILLKTTQFPVPSSVQTDEKASLAVSLAGEYWEVSLGGAKEVSWPVTP
jgi:hypothetical protein